LGDGGAVVTNVAEVADRVRSLRQYGWSSKYHVDRLQGQNSRLDEMQAAFLRVKLDHLDAWNDRRREIHRRYEQCNIADGRLINRSGQSYVGHLATLIADDRNVFRARMASYGVATDIHYPVPDHRQKVEISAAVSLPVTDWASDRVVTIPLFPELVEDEISTIVRALESR
jgi:dTDP-4-amino-4,6-dideoxygalactose transaminase